MTPTTLLYVVAHLLADLPGQTDRMAAHKFDDRIVRAQHCLVHLALSIWAGLVAGIAIWSTILIAVLIATAHFVIDSRRWAEPKDEFEDYPIWVDQTLHLTSIALILLAVA